MTIQRVLVVPDVHVPYHDPNAWELLLKVAKAFQPQHTIVLGDFADCYQLSSHDKDPRRATMMEEDMRAVNKELRRLEAATKGSQRVFLEGNHEYRLHRYLQTKAPELYKMMSIRRLFGLDKNGWKFVQYRRSFQLGNMRYTHDVGSAGKHAAAKSMEAMGHNVVIGHCHRAEMTVQGTLDGMRHVGFSFGWLGDSNEIDYMHRDKVSKDWTLGFGVGYYDTDSGFTTLSFVPILPTCHCILHGRKFSYP